MKPQSNRQHQSSRALEQVETLHGISWAGTDEPQEWEKGPQRVIKALLSGESPIFTYEQYMGFYQMVFRFSVSYMVCLSYRPRCRGAESTLRKISSTRTL